MTDGVDLSEFETCADKHAGQNNRRDTPNEWRPKQGESQHELNDTRSAHIEFAIEAEAEGGVFDEKRKTPFRISPLFDGGPHQRDGGGISRDSQRLDAEEILLQAREGQISRDAQKYWIVG